MCIRDRPKVDNIEGTGVFAYREKIGGRSYWYVVSIGVDKNIVVTRDVYKRQP